MISHHPAKFGGHRHRDSDMLLVAKGQDSRFLLVQSAIKVYFQRTWVESTQDTSLYWILVTRA